MIHFWPKFPKRVSFSSSNFTCAAVEPNMNMNKITNLNFCLSCCKCLQGKDFITPYILHTKIMKAIQVVIRNCAINKIFT